MTDASKAMVAALQAAAPTAAAPLLGLDYKYRITTDERGLARPSGAGCDIGVLEVQITPPTPLVVAPITFTVRSLEVWPQCWSGTPERALQIPSLRTVIDRQIGASGSTFSRSDRT